MTMLAGGYILLQKSSVQTYIIKKITEQLSLKTGAKISVGKVDFVFFNKLELNNVLLAGPENDTIFYTKLVSAKIDTLNIRNHKITFSELSFLENQISISRDYSNRFNFSFILDSLRTEKKDSVAIWKINCNNFKFNNSQIYFNSFETENNKHFIVNKLNIDVSDFSNYADSTTFKINKLTLNYNNEIK